MTKKQKAKSEPEYVIELTKVSRDFGVGEANIAAIDQIDLKIKPGEFVAIMGPSGCGKTTLLNTLGLLDNTFSGSYILDGQDVSNLSRTKKSKIRNQKIGFVFQNFNIISRLNILENVALPLLYSGVGKTKRLEAASKILKKFGLNKREYYMPWQLSGGQLQRIAIARALVNQPSIILADEPTGSLDSRSSHIIMEELARIHQSGQTIILVTHNPNLISYADRVINMIDGRIDSNIDKVKNPDKKIPVPKEVKNNLEDLGYLVLLQTINQLTETKEARKIKISLTFDSEDESYSLPVKRIKKTEPDSESKKVKVSKPSKSAKTKTSKTTAKKTSKKSAKTIKINQDESDSESKKPKSKTKTTKTKKETTKTKTKTKTTTKAKTAKSKAKTSSKSTKSTKTIKTSKRRKVKK